MSRRCDTNRTERGGSVSESNLPRSRRTPAGFEDQSDHQARSAPSVTSITCLPGPLHPLWAAMIAALGTVLVVDDDAVLRSSLESVLGDLGYRVLSTGSPDVAYQLLGSESAVAVLLDVRLPTMSGLSLYLAMTHRWPRLRGRVALMTGDADAPDVRTWAERNPCTVIRKPFSFREIKRWLDAVARPLDDAATG